MPTYEYRCDKCAHQFEQFQSITADPLKKCPACGKATLRRLLGTGGGVIFKGSGFYQTDYRSESYKKAAAAEKPDSGAAGAKSDAKESGNKAPAGDSGSATKAAPAESKPAKNQKSGKKVG